MNGILIMVCLRGIREMGEEKRMIVNNIERH
jgi:hypothetical protein